MKPSNWFLFIPLFIASCAREDSKLLITTLEKQAQTEEVKSLRKVANLEAGQCVKDIFSVGLVEKQIQELEKKYQAGLKVSGKWKHLDLSKLPVPQANFLKKYGHRLGDLNRPDDLDFSACKDVPCIFNTIYGKPGDVAGYVHYLWYLKMGNLLAATNHVYEAKSQKKPGIYNGKEIPLSAYLYREDEIYAFWRLLNLMQAPYTSLNQLSEILRVPQGESFDFEQEKKSNPEDDLLSETCGLSYSSGFINLQDGCLKVSSYDRDEGYFYQAVLHELVHQVDYHQGRENKESYRSHLPDYLEAARFYLKEYRDDEGKLRRQWEHHEDIKLVSSYAGVNPQENFAETLSLFRVEADSTHRSISENHWKFVADRFYQGQTYRSRQQIENWLNLLDAKLSQRALALVAHCAKSSENVKSSFFSSADFSQPLLASMVSCLGKGAYEISFDFTSEVKWQELEGCAILKLGEGYTFWQEEFKSRLLVLLNKYLMELKKDSAYFAKVQSFLDQIKDPLNAQKAYLSCIGQEKREVCYQEQVVDLAREALQSLNLPEAHEKELANLYFATHAFSNIQTYLLDYYKSFVQSRLVVIESEAKKLWVQCTQQPAQDLTSPQGSHFTLKEGYLVSSIYNCLNLSFQQGIEASAKKILQDQQFQQRHPAEEVLIQDFLKSELLSQLRAEFARRRKEEQASLAGLIESKVGQIAQQVRSDLSWVKDIIQEKNLIQQCQQRALELIDVTPLYEMKVVAFKSVLEKACAGIGQSAEYSALLDQSKSVLGEKALPRLEERIYELAKDQAKICVKKYPVDTPVNRSRFKKDREDCLIVEWQSMEQKAISEFAQDPLVVRFKLDMTDLKNKLEVNRRRLQLKIFKEFF